MGKINGFVSNSLSSNFYYEYKRKIDKFYR